jgi:hypothetical protein
MKLVVRNAEDRPDPGLLRIVARAHDFQERLIQDSDLTVPAIASQERLTIGYLSRLLRLPSLAPDIVTAIITANTRLNSAQAAHALSPQTPHQLGGTEKAAPIPGRIARRQVDVPRDASRLLSSQMLTPK